MQKWEYLIVTKSRVWKDPEVRKAWWKVGSEFVYAIGAKREEVKLWNGSHTCDLFCELGDQGWELVSEAPRSEVCGGYQSTGGATSIAIDLAGFTSMVEYVFKRPKE